MAAGENNGKAINMALAKAKSISNNGESIGVMAWRKWREKHQLSAEKRQHNGSAYHSGISAASA